MHKSSSNNEILELTTSDMRAFQLQNVTYEKVTEQPEVVAKDSAIEKQISSAIEKISQEIVHEKLKKTVAEIIIDLKNLIKKLENI